MLVRKWEAEQYSEVRGQSQSQSGDNHSYLAIYKVYIRIFAPTQFQTRKNISFSYLYMFTHVAQVRITIIFFNFQFFPPSKIYTFAYSHKMVYPYNHRRELHLEIIMNFRKMSSIRKKIIIHTAETAWIKYI